MAGSTMKEKGSMMNRTVKSAVAVAAIAAMSLGTLAACGSSTSGDDAKGKVYYLNFKPEAADQWAALAKEYAKEKGVDVKVQTAASGTYEQTLKSEIAKTEAPTLFRERPGRLPELEEVHRRHVQHGCVYELTNQTWP